MRHLALLATLALAGTASAAPMLVLNHQGRLLTADDKPQTDAATLKFELHTLFASGQGDVVVWSDEYARVPFSKDGAYSIPLGDTSVGTGHHALTTELFSEDRWLAISVNGVALLPWLRVGMVPLASAALDAKKLGGKDASFYALKTDVAPDSAKLGGVRADEYALKTDVPAIAADSHKLEGHGANEFLFAADAASTYLAQTDAATKYLAQTDAATKYLAQTDAATKYLARTDAAGTYLAKSDAAGTYLAKSDAAGMYLAKTDATATYLAKTDAAATYQPKGDYVTTIGGTLSGTLTGPTLAATTQVATPVLKLGPAYVRWNATAGALETSPDNASWSPVSQAEPPTAWWNTSFGYRRAIRIDGPVPKDTTLRVPLEHATLATTSKARADGNDIRLVYGSTELARWIDNLGTDAAYVEFRVQADIPAGENYQYWVYYGNPSATAPDSDRMKVYLLWDDFSDGNYTANPTWQLVTGGASVVDYAVVGSAGSDKALQTSSQTSGDSFDPGVYFPGGTEWTDVVLEVDMNDTSPGTYPYPGPALRVKNPATAATTAWWFEHYTNDRSLTMRPIIGNTDYSWTYGGRTVWPQVANTWNRLRIEVVGQQVTEYMNGMRVLGPWKVGATHAIDKGSIALGGHTHTSAPTTLWDNVKVTRYFGRDNTMRLGRETAKP